MSFYQAAPGLYLMEGVSLAEHQAAVAGNYSPFEDDFGFLDPAPGSIEYNPRGPIWVTADMREIPIPELSDLHLINIINRFPKRLNQSDFQYLVAELFYRASLVS